MKKYFVIHAGGVRIVEGYTIVMAFDGSPDVQDVIDEAYAQGYFDCFEDTCSVSYVKEIGEPEFALLKAQAYKPQEEWGGLLYRIFPEEDLAKAKALSYENWDKALNGERTDIGFDFQWQWIANPFLESTGRFPFQSQKEMYEYYGRDCDGDFCPDAVQKVYDFILKILGLYQPDVTEDSYTGDEWVGEELPDTDLPFL